MPITALQLITVTGTYRLLNDVTAAGKIEFVPQFDAIRDSADNLIVIGTSLTANLDGSGHFSLAIPATNDPDYEPAGWTYRVIEHITGVVPERSYSISVPYDAPGATIDLADVAPVAASTGTTYAFGRIVNTDGTRVPVVFTGETTPSSPTPLPGDIWISSAGVQIWEP